MTTRSIARGAKTVRRAFRPRTLTRSSLLFGTALGCSIAIMTAAAPQQAWAANECGAVVAGTVTCDADGAPATDVNPYPTGIEYTAAVGEDLTVVIEGTVDIVSPGVSGVLAYGSLDNDVTIDVETGASVDAGYVGFGAISYGTGTATVTVDAGVDITAGTVGIYANATDGGSSVVTSGADIVADGDTAAGVPVVAGIYSAAAEDSTVTNTGSIDVTTTTDYYAFGIVSSGDGVSTVVSTGDIVVNNYYLSGASYGVLSIGDDGSSVTQTGNVDVYAYGLFGAYGIISQSSLGDASVSVTGNVSVEAYASNAIGVAAIAPTGTASIVVVGDVDVYGFADTVGVLAAGEDAVVDVTGNVTVDTGAGTAYGVQTTSTDSSDVTVVGDITVTSGNLSFSGGDAYGIDVTAGGTADIDVTGNITVTAIEGFAVGVDVYADGDITVDVDGTIDVTAYGSTWGVFASNTADGDVTINVGDVIVASGEDLGLGAGTAGGAGIQAYAGGTLATVSVTADNVTTSGANTEGVQAVATYGYASVTTGTVTTTGDGSEGIIAYGYYGATVDSGTVTTSGAASTGIYAYSFLGEASVTSDSVTTSGLGAGGIYAYGYAGATVDSGTVTTSGDYSIGIEARSGYNGVTVTSDTVSTTGYASVGILAFGTGGTTVTSGSVTTTGDYAEGIVALDIVGPVVVDSGDVNTSGYAATGIRAGSYGDVTVTADTVTTSGAGAVGINAYSLNTVYNASLVDVTFDSVVTSGDPTLLGVVPYVGPVTANLYYYGEASHGVVVDGGAGNVSIVGGDVTTSGDGANGIIASGFGDVYINVDDVTTTGDALINFVYTGPGTPYTDYYRGAYGIYASVTGGDLTLIADTVTTSGDYGIGIVAIGNAYYDSVATTYYGDVNVQVNNVTTSGDFADGIIAQNAGGETNVLVTGTVETSGEGADGIIAVSNNYYDSTTGDVLLGEVNVDANTVITSGDAAYGIYAVGGGADVNIVVDDVRTYGDGSVGIFAAAYNYYDSGPTPGNIQGDVVVDAGSVYTGGDGSTAILAYSEGGNVTVTADNIVTVGDFSAGIVATAAYYGVDPVLGTFYSGNVTVNAGSISTSGDASDGIFATAEGGNVTINADDVVVSGLGSDAIVAITGGLDVANSDNILINTTGLISSDYGYGIYAVSADSTNINVAASSEIYGYEMGIFAYSVVSTAIENDGVISGGLGLAIDIDGGSANIFNDSTGVIYGAVDLTDNADVFDNEGTFEAYGTSDFGLGADLLDNDGVIGIRRDFATAGNVTFTGLETLRNDGDIDFRNGHVNDQLILPNTTFVGVAGSSTITVDAQLGGAGSAADRLILSGTGNATGVTEIRVNDLLAATPGVMNFGGILVVDSAANEAGTEFTMDNIDKGFVEYSLFFDAAADNWLIVGLPDDEAFELVAFQQGAQDFWRRSGDAWGGRMMEIRDAQAWGDGGARREGWELWMQTHIGDEDFDNFETYTAGGFTFAQDLSTHSDWRGFQFGFDNLTGDATNYSFWGLTMGFTEQETRFEFDNNSFEIEGWNVGAYAGWNWGGLYLNGLIKGDFFELDANFTSIPEMIELDGTTWGAKGEIGYRWDGGGFFFEPHAELAWTTTDLDGFDQAGLQADFGDADSLVGKAGARIGGTFGSGSVVLTPYIGVYAVEEFEGDNEFAFATGGVPFVVTDEAREGYGQVDFGFTTQTFYGLEGFMKGEVKFGDEADGWTARMGARWRW